MLRPASYTAQKHHLHTWKNASSVHFKPYITLRKLQTTPSLTNPNFRFYSQIVTARAIDHDNSTASIKLEDSASRKASVFASVNSSSASSQPASSTYQSWWAPHQQVVGIISSSFWAACLGAGAVFWFSWAARRAWDKSKLKLSSLAPNPLEPSKEAEDKSQSAVAALNGAGPGGGTAQQAVDDLSDPFAPIRYILKGDENKAEESTNSNSQGLSGQSQAAQEGQGSTSGTKQHTTSTSQVDGKQSSNGISRGIQESNGAGNQQEDGWEAAEKLQPGWWQALSKVYYINFGARLGILPMLSTPLDGKTLIAFADKADAEFVASSIRLEFEKQAEEEQLLLQQQQRHSSAAATATVTKRRVVKPMVVAATPTLLGEMSKAQQAVLSVVPAGVLPGFYSAHMPVDTLDAVLQEASSGLPLSVKPEDLIPPSQFPSTSQSLNGKQSSEQDKPQSAEQQLQSAQNTNGVVFVQDDEVSSMLLQQRRARSVVATPSSLSGDDLVMTSVDMDKADVISQIAMGPTGLARDALETVAQTAQSATRHPNTTSTQQPASMYTASESVANDTAASASPGVATARNSSEGAEQASTVSSLMFNRGRIPDGPVIPPVFDFPGFDDPPAGDSAAPDNAQARVQESREQGATAGTNGTHAGSESSTSAGSQVAAEGSTSKSDAAAASSETSNSQARSGSQESVVEPVQVIEPEYRISPSTPVEKDGGDIRNAKAPSSRSSSNSSSSHGVTAVAASQADAATSGQTSPSGDDDLMAEYEKFKEMFIAQRESSSSKDTSNAGTPTSTQAPKDMNQIPMPDTTQTDAQTSHTGNSRQAALQPLNTDDTSTSLQTSQSDATAVNSTRLESPSGAAIEAGRTKKKAKTVDDLVQDMLARTGPTDATLEKAMKLVGRPELEGEEDDLLNEWYELEKAEKDKRAEKAKLEQEASNAARNKGSTFRDRIASAAAATKQASSNVGVADMANMQKSLEEMQQQLQQLVSRSGQDGKGVDITELTALQQRMSQLMSEMSKVSTSTTATTSSPSGDATAINSAPSNVNNTGATKTPGSTASSNSQAGSTSTASPASSTNQSQGPAKPTGFGSAWKMRPLKQNKTSETSKPAIPAPVSDSNSSNQEDTQQAAAFVNQADNIDNGKVEKQEGGKKEVRVDEDGEASVILSKRTGISRPWKKNRDPSERQATVKEALRFVSTDMETQGVPETYEEYDDDGNRLPPPDPSVDKVSGIDWNKIERDARKSQQPAEPTLKSTTISSSNPRSSSSSSTPATATVSKDGSSSSSSGGNGAPSQGIDTGAEKWWQRRFQAVFMPVIRYDDGAAGYFQVDCSMVDGKRDLRVVTFEDRHDCMHCITIIRQWPEYQYLDMEMGMLPTKHVEAEIVRAWKSQVDAGAASTHSRPAGIVVFRRDKLPMRVGMSQDEFTHLVVYQAAAQLSLSKVGYQFDDF